VCVHCLVGMVIGCFIIVYQSMNSKQVEVGPSCGSFTVSISEVHGCLHLWG
jgi:hypothetical protein